MNCSQFEDAVGPYLASRLEADTLAEFTAHSASCPACAAVLEQSEELRLAVLADPVDPAHVISAVRTAIDPPSSARWWLGVAASITFAVAGAAYWTQTRPSPDLRLLAAAARDHRIEVREQQPRHWQLDTVGVGPLLAAYGVESSDLERLRPAGFHLDKAKQCGLSGERVLHMVFTDGQRSVSVYIRSYGARQGVTATEEFENSGVSEFHRGRLSGVVVGDNRGVCADVVRRLSAI